MKYPIVQPHDLQAFGTGISSVQVDPKAGTQINSLIKQPAKN
jgi:hypothetical protein